MFEFVLKNLYFSVLKYKKGRKKIKIITKFCIIVHLHAFKIFSYTMSYLSNYKIYLNF
jgi:hypothetical protein